MLTGVSICVCMCENLGIQAKSNQSRNCDSCEQIYGNHYRASTRLRYQRFENEPRVVTLIRWYLFSGFSPTKVEARKSFLFTESSLVLKINKGSVSLQYRQWHHITVLSVYVSFLCIVFTVPYHLYLEPHIVSSIVGIL